MKKIVYLAMICAATILASCSGSGKKSAADSGMSTGTDTTARTPGGTNATPGTSDTSTNSQNSSGGTPDTTASH